MRRGSFCAGAVRRRLTATRPRHYPRWRPKPAIYWSLRRRLASSYLPFGRVDHCKAGLDAADCVSKGLSISIAAASCPFSHSISPTSGLNEGTLGSRACSCCAHVRGIPSRDPQWKDADNIATRASGLLGSKASAFKSVLRPLEVFRGCSANGQGPHIRPRDWDPTGLPAGPPPPLWANKPKTSHRGITREILLIGLRIDAAIGDQTLARFQGPAASAALRRWRLRCPPGWRTHR